MCAFVQRRTSGWQGSEPDSRSCPAQIVKYKNVASEIASFKDTITIGFIKVNAKPLRQALSTWASKWVYLFTHYLQDKVVNSITDLYAFMGTSNATLDLKVMGEGGEDEAEYHPELDPEEAGACGRRTGRARLLVVQGRDRLLGGWWLHAS
jgi:dynein heavy chain